MFGRLFGRKPDPALDTIRPDDYFASADVWTPVTSSNVKAVAYYGQGRTGLLRVRFHSGSEYEYQGPPYEVYAGMLDAPSKGKYLHRQVKGRYGYRLIRK